MNPKPVHFVMINIFSFQC
uniref:Uncharacterized protein n=1 Tax=Anguilla anguilla TaxID=7936 RepID=A0A0E9TQI0_ANGAN